MGRRKIEMEMVKDSSSRQVTFSKRRTGLFKKANELATLCGAQVAIVVFSPGGKPFSFGHPSVEAVTQQFLNQDTKPKVGSQQQAKVEKLSQQLNDLLKQIQAEKKRGEMLDKEIKASGKHKCQKPVNELSLDELLQMKQSMEELREKLKGRVSEIEASSSLLLLSNNGAKEADPDN
ncbi:Transcription factor [Theobroma cacao]|nr:Transcription factor [Theobroma cacao]